MVKKIKQQRSASAIEKPQPINAVFGFSQLQPISYTEAENDSHFFLGFLDRLRKLSSLDWNTIWTTHRHSFGTEMIPSSRLKKAASNSMPLDLEKLIVLRATGDNHAFLGYREGNVFQILFIEYRFGDIYQH